MGFAWVTDIPLWLLGPIMLAIMVGMAGFGAWMRLFGERRGRAERLDETQQGYVVSGILGLLALIMGFTFAMVLDRFEARRMLVVEDANAIEALYLRAQLLDQPHRARISALLVRYTDNHIALAKVAKGEGERLLEQDNRLLVDLWSATLPAFQSIRTIDFSSSFVDSVNRVIEVDATRKSARTAQVPPAIFLVEFFYAVVTATVMGYVLTTRRSQFSAIFLMALLTLSFMLMSDLNRPVDGAIRESQAPTERLSRALHALPPAAFDRYAPPAAPQATPSPR